MSCLINYIWGKEDINCTEFLGDLRYYYNVRKAIGDDLNSILRNEGGNSCVVFARFLISCSSLVMFPACSAHQTM